MKNNSDVESAVSVEGLRQSIFASRIVFLFLLSFVIPILARVLSWIGPSVHDTTVLPVLFGVVFPIIPLVWAGVFLATFFRERVPGIDSLVAIVSGVSLGFFLVYDWWYYRPYALALFFPVLFLFLSRQLWGVHKLRAILIAALVLVVFACSIGNFKGGLPMLDSRFGLGFLEPLSVLTVLLAVLLVGLICFVYFVRTSREGVKLNRGLMVALIERDPRCKEYFDRVNQVTGSELRSTDSDWSRPYSAASARVGTRLFSSNGYTAFPKLDGLCWRLAGAALPVVGQIAKLFRSPLKEPTFDTKYFIKLLEEAEQSSKERYYFARGEELEGEGDDNVSLEKCGSSAEDYFANAVLLREAWIEANYYFGTAVVEPDQSVGSKERIAVLCQAIKGGQNDQSPVPYPQVEDDVDNRAIALEYENLWIANVDRVVCGRWLSCGSYFREEDSENDPVDLQRLTESFVRFRSRCDSQVRPMYRAVADLSLLLFVIDETEAQALVENTLRPHLSSSIAGNPTDLEWAELSLSVLAVYFWRAPRVEGAWADPRIAKPFFRENRFTDASSPDLCQEAREHIFRRGRRAMAYWKGLSLLQRLHEPNSAGRRRFVTLDRDIQEVMPLFGDVASDNDLVLLRQTFLARIIPSLAPNKGQDLIAQYEEPLVRAIITQTAVPGDAVVEKPRFPIRAHFWQQATAVLVGALLLAFFYVNPLGKVVDHRIAKDYREIELTTVAVGDSEGKLWLGSKGAGIRTYSPEKRLFEIDITRASTGDSLLGDYIKSISFSEKDSDLVAVIASETEDGPTGLQIGSASGESFRTPLLVDTSRFEGLDDSSASSVAATDDGLRMMVGTRGFGVGIYDIGSHAWTHVIRKSDGLPSDHINDLASMGQVSGLGGQAYLYVATDKGLAWGRIDAAGRYSVSGHYDRASGLAGDNVVELVKHGGELWYRTEGRGMGRIFVEGDGVPLGNGASPMEVLVTENRLPGLREEEIVKAVGSSIGPTTWFLANKESELLVGRYREKPHDTLGIEAPSSLKVDNILTSVAAPTTGRGVAFGSSEGLWAFFDSSNAEGRDSLTGGLVGFEGEPIKELAFAHQLPSGPESHILAKSRSESGVSILQSVTIENSVPWSLATVVGGGRMTNMTSLDEISCADGSSQDHKVFFGTRDAGIGVWSRPTMEISRVDLPLRTPGSLDLAVSGETVFQVTSDRAVDVFQGGKRFSLVPPEGGRIQPDQLAAAAASGPLCVLGSPSAISLYDASKFEWSNIAAVNGLSQLEIAGNRVWARSSGRNLSTLPLDGEVAEWTSVAQGVRDFKVGDEIAMALRDTESGSAGLSLFSAAGGDLVAELIPARLNGSEGNWRFAVGDRDRLLFPSTSSFQLYDFQTRSWSNVPYGEGFSGSPTWAKRNEDSLWMLNGAGDLARLDLGGGQEGIHTVVEGVEKVALGKSSIAVLHQADRSLGVLDRQEPEEFVVGRPFEGELSGAVDMIERDEHLVLITPDRLGLYDWKKHDWQSIQSTEGALRKLQAVDDHVWVEAAISGGSRLLHWNTEAGELRDVVGEAGIRPVYSRLSQGVSGLYALGTGGGILRVLPNEPESWTPFWQATSFPGQGELNSKRAALIGEDLMVADSGGISNYSLKSGWSRLVDIPRLEAQRLFQPPKGGYLLAQGRSMNLVSLPGGRITPLSLSGNQSGQLKGQAATDAFAVAAYQIDGEPGCQLVLKKASDFANSVELIGDPMPQGGITNQVVELDGGRTLLRLTEAGGLSSYSTNRRGWSLERVSARGLPSQLFVVGDKVFAWCPNERAIHVRDQGGSWELFTSVPQGVTKLRQFGGMLLLDSAEDDLYSLKLSGNRGSIVQIRTAAARRDLSMLNGVKEFAELGQILVLIGNSGRLAAFDWSSQRWLPCGSRTADRFFQIGSELYLHQAGRLAGPLRFDVNGLTVSSDSQVDDLFLVGSDLFRLSRNESLFRLVRGSWLGMGRDLNAKRVSAQRLVGMGKITEAWKMRDGFFFAGANGGLANFNTVTNSWRFFAGGKLVRSGAENFMLKEGALFGPILPDSANAGQLTGVRLAFEPNSNVLLRDAYVAAGELVATSQEGDVYVVEAGAFKKVDREAPRDDGSVPNLRDWSKLVPIVKNWKQQQGGDLMRQIADQWIPLSLGTKGFAHQDVVASLISADRVRLYTRAGRVTLGDPRSPAMPSLVEPLHKLPAGLESGEFVELDGSTFLREGARTDGLGRLWEAAENQWREVVPARKDVLLSPPPLVGKLWTWDRDKSTERVTWSPPGQPKLECVLGPSSRRFSWDVIYAVGQAEGRAWAATALGLFEISAKGMHPYEGGPTTEALRGMSFLDSTGVEPGALVNSETGQIAWIFENGRWAPAVDLPAADNHLGNIRLESASWTLRRDGNVMLKAPQDPKLEIRAELVSGRGGFRWNFEQILDLQPHGETCYVASEIGVSGYRDGMLFGIWPIEGVNTLLIDQGALAANIGNNRIRSFDGKRWGVPQNWQPVPNVDEGTRFRVTGGDSPAVEVRRVAGGAFAASQWAGGRFAFDEISDVAMTSKDSIVLSTLEGSYEIQGNGDLRRLSIGNLQNRARFFSVLREGEEQTLFASTTNQYFKYQVDDFNEIPASEGRQAEIVGQNLLVKNPRWMVSRTQGGQTEVGLRLPADQVGEYRKMQFDGAAGRFRIDQFLSVAPGDEADEIMVGTKSGIQLLKIDDEGIPALKGMWNRGAEDGLDEFPVPAMVRGEGGDLIAEVQSQGGTAYHHKTVGQRFEPSNSRAFTNARILRASDPNGWGIRLDATRRGSAQIQWKKEPAFLKFDRASGRTRFAHNLVQSILLVADKLVLGTEGGLVMIDSELGQAVGNHQLISRVFLEARQALADEMTATSIRWLIAGPGDDFQIRMSNGTVWTLAGGGEPVRASGGVNEVLVAEDDILRWREVGPQAVEIQFQAGIAKPETLEPSFAAGTFRFLQLQDAAEGRNSLVSSEDGQFWSTGAGIVQYDLVQDIFVRLHGASQDGGSLLTTQGMIQDPRTRQPFARSELNDYIFSSAEEGWRRFEGEIEVVRDTINESPLLTWKRSGDGGVILERHRCDRPEGRFFIDGKPAIDEVLSLTVGDQDGEPRLAIGTTGGVVEYGAENFEYSAHFQSAFVGSEGGESEQIIEVASSVVDDSWQYVARNHSGQPFVRVNDGWEAGELQIVERVLEDSYRRIEDQAFWTWSRYPSGLRCTILATNGHPYPLGHSNLGGRGALFSNGRMSFDEVGSVAVAGKKILATTPVGIVVYDVPKGEPTDHRFELLVWASESAGTQVVEMDGVTGIVSDDERLVAWGASRVFEQDLGLDGHWSEIEASGEKGAGPARSKLQE